MAHRLGVLVTIALGALIPACEDGRPELRETTEHFEVHARSDVELCNGLLDRLERHFDVVGSYLHASDSERIPIYIYDDDADFAANGCPEAPEASGCAYPDGYVTTKLLPGQVGGGLDVLDHELVHVYMDEINEHPSFFQEGIAVSLACGVERTAFDLHGTFDPAEFLEQRAWDGLTGNLAAVSDETAGAIVKFLVERFGIERFLRVYRRIPRDATRAEIDRVFVDVYGSSATDLIAEWVALPNVAALGICLPVFPCAQDPLPGPEGAEIELDCMARSDADDAVFSRAVRTVELGDEGRFRLDAQDLATSPYASRLEILFHRCEGEGVEGFGYLPYASTGSFWSGAEPGPAWVSISQTSAEASRVRLAFTSTDARWSPLDDAIESTLPEDASYLEVVPDLDPADGCDSPDCQVELSLGVPEERSIEWIAVRFSPLDIYDEDAAPDVWFCRDELREDCLTLDQIRCYDLDPPHTSVGMGYCDYQTVDGSSAPCPGSSACFTTDDVLTAGRRYTVGWRGVAANASMLISLRP